MNRGVQRAMVLPHDLHGRRANVHVRVARGLAARCALSEWDGSRSAAKQLSAEWRARCCERAAQLSGSKPNANSRGLSAVGMALAFPHGKNVKCT